MGLWLLVSLRLNQRFHQHLCGGWVTNPRRGTELDTGACALLPGEYGQWSCVGQGLDPGSPYLLLWGALMCLEGTSCTDQRVVLKACGWVVPFRWRVGTSNKVENPVCNSLLLGCVTPSLIVDHHLSWRSQGDAAVWAGARVWQGHWGLEG